MIKKKTKILHTETDEKKKSMIKIQFDIFGAFDLLSSQESVSEGEKCNRAPLCVLLCGGVKKKKAQNFPPP